MSPPSASTRKLWGEASLNYQGQLIGSPAEEYLVGRGLSIDILKSFQVGFCGIPHQGDDIYKGRISLPFVTPSGVVAIQFRSVGSGDKSTRFLMRGSNKRIYNPSVLLEPHRKIYLCEGPIDTMSVALLGLPAIGIPGVDNWNPVFARALRNRRVVILADSDDEGQGKRFAEKVSSQVDEADTVGMPAGHDVNSFLVKEGASALRALIEY